MKRITPFVFLIPLLSIASAARSENLLVNGNFEAGSAGFLSSYTSVRTDTGEHTYDVVRDPRDSHRNGASFKDHTTGEGFMMVVNGSTLPNGVAWSQTVSVRPNSAYLFSGWGASWGEAGSGLDPSPAVLRVLINGQQHGAEVRLAGTNGLWQSFGTVWYSESSTQAVIEIYDQNTEWYGNDFAIDDLSVVRLAGEPPAGVFSGSTESFASDSVAPVRIWSAQGSLLPHDRAFGFALPPDVGGAFRIEASSDLIQWVQATNVAFYFKDFDSANFDERFYRFKKE